MISPITPPAIIEQADLGETITSLSTIIERNAIQLTKVKEELKLHRESLKSVLDNDTELSAATQQAEKVKKAVKLRKTEMANQPQVVSLTVKINELKEQKKEIEETLSNHLVNYHQMTNSSSFDTSEGDQWEFSVKAKIKPKQLKLFEK